MKRDELWVLIDNASRDVVNAFELWLAKGSEGLTTAGLNISEQDARYMVDSALTDTVGAINPRDAWLRVAAIALGHVVHIDRVNGGQPVALPLDRGVCRECG